MGVVPANVLPEDGLQEEPPDFEDLCFGGVIETGDKDVTHDKVDGADDGCTASKYRNLVQKVEIGRKVTLNVGLCYVATLSLQC